jgi:hypothetical protein
MKTYFRLLTLLLALTSISTLRAQYCGGSGPSVCTAPASLPGVGFYPPYDSLPCANIGVAYDQTINFMAPTTVVQGGTTYTLNYIKVDTISNLPCGLCWRMGNSNNQINGGGTGCVRITGTTYDAPGQYKIRVIVTANVQVGPFPVNVSNQNAESLGVKYWVRVQSTNGSCPSVDTLAVGNTATTPGSIAPPTIAGNSNICSGASTTLSVSGNYYAYKWSTGASTSSISVNTGGTYTVTVYGNCASATATKTITSTNLTPSITPGGPTTFCQGGSVTLDAGAGYSAYLWNNGATTQSITVSNSGNYTVTVTQNSCTASDVETVTVNNATVSITPAGTVTICSGSSITLDAGANATAYSWSTGATSQTISVNQGGTYTVTITQNGCTATDNVTVTVSANLSPVITPASPINICPGGVVTLDAGPGYDSYIWSTGDNTQTVVASSAGNYSVTVSQGSCSGSSSVTVTNNAVPINVSITPQGPTTFCDGGSVTLDAGSGYSAYNWSEGSQSQSITVTSSGKYKVTVVENACVGIDSILVTVNPLPTPSLNPSGTINICDGQTVTVNAGAGYDSYLWSNGATTQTVSVSSNTTLDVTVTDNGCTGSSNNSTTVNVNPVPDASIWISGSSTNPVLHASPVGGSYQYEWYYGTTLVQNATDSVYSPTPGNFGQYSVIVTQNGCSDTADFYIPTPAGVEDVVNFSNVVIQPNPAKDLVAVTFDLNRTANVKMAITDLTGRIVKEISNEKLNSGRHTQSVNINEIAAGIYLLQISTERGAVNSKFIKE